jgi:hypothetical protein
MRVALLIGQHSVICFSQQTQAPAEAPIGSFDQSNGLADQLPLFREIHMADVRATFDLLLDLLQQVNDDEIESTVQITRRYSADVSLLGYPQHLIDLVSRVPVEAREWFGTVLCVRAQQVGRMESWNRFVEQSFREISSWALD